MIIRVRNSFEKRCGGRPIRGATSGKSCSSAVSPSGTSRTHLTAITFPIYPGQDVRRTGVPWFNVGVLEPGALLTREDFLVVGPNPKVHMHDKYTPTICFGEIPTISVDDVLRMMLAKAFKLVSEFEGLF
jgi:hypothetical protein